MIFLDLLGVAYAAVRKAACTSVKAGLLLADSTMALSETELARRGGPHGLLPTSRFKRNIWIAKKGLYRFTVIRDPLKRILSAYCDRVLKRGLLANSPKMRQQTLVPMDPDPDTFFRIWTSIDGSVP